ncbi:amidohydrolase [Aurantiacibacter gilvus]|uniref:Amidohydrolase n=1 Tax=Aurantiacibacter gilvus TaxID=3139141 RepID=A0ABU9IF99_9SPHN
MPNKISKVATSLCLAMTWASAATAQSAEERAVAIEEPATVVIVNGRVMTPDGFEEAVAIENGIIVAVGSNDEISGFAGSATRILDAQGGAVLPGFHDLHVHSIGGGMSQTACGFRPAASPEEIRQAVAGCVAESEDGEWIQGGNWIANVFADGQQTKEFLDEVAPNNPVMLSDESHHSAWVNSAALAAAGVTRDTPDPVNGHIELDAEGEPTGVLREAAMGLVSRVVPPPTTEAMAEALGIAADLMLSYGVTSYTDAGLNPVSMQVISDASRSGDIRLRIRGCMMWNPNTPDGGESALATIASRHIYATDRFTPDCVKTGLDGVPTESHTAAMLEPYAHSEETGMNSIAPEVLFPAVIDFDRQGLHVKFHAAGDAAVRNAINAIEAARSANGAGGPFHDVAHASFVSPSDVDRVTELNASWEFSPYIWYPSTITRDIVQAIGPERMERWIPIADALDADALVGAGSDWSVVPSIDPWLAIETMVTRQLPGGSDEALGAGQAVSLEQALQIFTLNGARIMQQADRVGTIEPGKFADIFVTLQDPFSMPVTELHNVEVRWTFIEGEVVYDSTTPPASLEGVNR